MNNKIKQIAFVLVSIILTLFLLKQKVQSRPKGIEIESDGKGYVFSSYTSKGNGIIVNKNKIGNGVKVHSK